MVLRDRNHPCVVMWSLGNEAGSGSSFAEMKSAILELDKTRPVHYEGCSAPSVTDVISHMYPREEILTALGNHISLVVI